VPGWLIGILGLAAIAAILATTPQGRRLRQRLPARLRAGGAPAQDHEYLLRVCHGDPAQVKRLLDLERARDPEMSDARAYRLAIRRYLRDRG
jgi:hypothetical protein